MKFWPLINTLYGQARGYERLSIQTRVKDAASKSAGELALEAQDNLKKRIIEALICFPIYAKLVNDRIGTLPTMDDGVKIEELPILTKDDIRFILSESGNVLPSETIKQATGGSTGIPLHFLITRNSYEWCYAVSNRGYSWAGADEGRRSFYIWGEPINPLSTKQRLKAAIHNRMLNRRFFNSFRFSLEDKKNCCNLINQFKPDAIVGYAGNIAELARFVESNPGILEWRARTLITAAEALPPGARGYVEKYLADELFQSYGSREFMLIGMECRKHSGYHISSDNLYVEVVDGDGNALPIGEQGRILITDLHNAATPFIRYEIGDLGSVGDTCSCGLPFPILSSVDGRVQETIIRRDGGKLTALFIPHLMKEFEWVKAYQIHQDAPGAIYVNLITGDDRWCDKTMAIESRLREKLGSDMEIDFKRVDSIQRTASGKTLIVIHGSSLSNGQLKD